MLDLASCLRFVAYDLVRPYEDHIFPLGVVIQLFKSVALIANSTRPSVHVVDEPGYPVEGVEPLLWVSLQKVFKLKQALPLGDVMCADEGYLRCVLKYLKG